MALPMTCGAGLLLAALAVSPAAAAASASNLADMFKTMRTCLGDVRVAPGTDVTVQFMLNRRGALIGKPRITHAGWAGDEAQRKASAAAIAQGFDRCLPIEISDALGGAIAGRLIVYRFQAPAARQENT